MTHVFISHSHNDAGFVRQVGKQLEANGIEPWLADSLEPGDDWLDQLNRAVTDTQVFLFFLSPDAMKSAHFQFEVGAALGRARESGEVRLILVLIGGNTLENLPSVLRRFNVIDAADLQPDQVAGMISETLHSLHTGSRRSH